MKNLSLTGIIKLNIMDILSSPLLHSICISFKWYMLHLGFFLGNLVPFFKDACNGLQTYGFHIADKVFIGPDMLSEFSHTNAISRSDQFDHSPLLFAT